jgi:hypothetical protein
MGLCTNKFCPPFLGARKGAKETWLQLKYYKFTSTPLR